MPQASPCDPHITHLLSILITNTERPKTQELQEGEFEMVLVSCCCCLRCPLRFTPHSRKLQPGSGCMLRSCCTKVVAPPPALGEQLNCDGVLANCPPPGLAQHSGRSEMWLVWVPGLSTFSCFCMDCLCLVPFCSPGSRRPSPETSETFKTQRVRGPTGSTAWLRRNSRTSALTGFHSLLG